MEQEATARFHDCESGDIYDLYTACNGAMHGGLLDVRKLDELSPAELDVLDVERLREVWRHAASGCAECDDIIRTLNAARTPRSADESSRGQAPAVETTTT